MEDKRETIEEGLIVVSPSILGYSRKYFFAVFSVFVYTVAFAVRSWLISIYSQLPFALFDSLALVLFILMLVLSWVLRSPEATASTFLALALPIPLALLLEPASAQSNVLLQLLASRYVDLLPFASLLASLLVAVAVEARRRTTVYEVNDIGVIIRTGIWRRQEQTIPYTSIGRIVFEQSLLGRLLDYGTVIIVSPAEWGAEYYTRNFAVGAGKGGGAIRVGYARTLKEVSRDPGKCIYGVRRPRGVKEAIEARLRAIHGSELEQARYLKEIRDKLTGS
jgi:membrane protein YdbS with pleckstrin-like domain